MWIKTTFIPLSVAFIDDKGVIINVEEMKPETLDAHMAKKPAKYFLEMGAGWFKKRRLGAVDECENEPVLDDPTHVHNVGTDRATEIAEIP
jgi:uncharacterized protein